MTATTFRVIYYRDAQRSIWFLQKGSNSKRCKTYIIW